MDNHFFSIVIPTYNDENFLEKAVKSILNQTFDNYEIIIIDNYSEDNTESLIKNFNNKNIKYIKNHNHGILGKSRNIGINESSSEWIAFLDSDDIWYRDRLEILFNFVKKNKDYDVICTNELIVNKIHNTKKVWRYGPYRNDFYEILLKYGSCISTTGSIVKKKYLLDKKILFSEKKDFAPFEDYDFWLKIAKSNGKFKFLNDILGEHLFHNESWGAKNRLLCRKSELSILKYHIFELQDFTNKKKNLWSYAESRLVIEDLIELFYSKNYFKLLITFFTLACKHPIKLLFHIAYRIKRKILV